MGSAERALIAIAMVASASAAQAETRHRVNLPAGRLGPAAVALGQQAGISIGVPDPVLAALRVRKVRGRLSVRQALARLLDGSGATFVSLGDDSWRIVRGRAAPVQLRPERPPETHRPTVEQPPPEDIIVTASKRATPLSDYPGSVAVLEMDDFPAGTEGRGTDAIAARLPGVTSTHFGPGRNKLFIRGIADSSFNGPTQATVGQYFGETRLNYNAPDPDLRLYDIATIEVLQGPQGTLHGAGSLGGVLRILPVAPKLDLVQGSVSGSVASTAHGAPSYDLSAMLNVPLAGDRVGLRLVGYGVRDGGYIDDRLRGLKDVNRTDTFGGRAWLRAEPGTGWTIDLGGTFQSIEGEDSQYADRDGPDLTKESMVAQAFSNDYALGQLVIRKQWDGLSLVSATGVVEQDLSETYDASQPGAPPSLFRQRNRISLIATENRLAREAEDGWGWVIGTSLVRNRYRLKRDFGLVTFARSLTGVENGVDEATLFGETTVGLTPNVSLTGGGRLTHARLSGEALDAPTLMVAREARMQARRGETTFLPSLALSFAPNDDINLFVRYQEGFRPGGIGVRDDFVHRYRNDDVATAEAGLRYGTPGVDLFDVALAVAYTRWNDVQADQIDGGGLPITVNIGDGRIYSLDARVGWRPLPGLSLEAAGVVADSRLSNPLPSTIIVAASDLPNVARFNGRVGADYRAWIGGALDLNVSAWARYVGKSRLGIGPVLGVAQGDYLDTAISARIGNERHGVTLSATNLLDTVGNRFALGSPFTLVQNPQITPLRPRTIRIGADLRF